MTNVPAHLPSALITSLRLALLMIVPGAALHAVRKVHRPAAADAGEPPSLFQESVLVGLFGAVTLLLSALALAAAGLLNLAALTILAALISAAALIFVRARLSPMTLKAAGIALIFIGAVSAAVMLIPKPGEWIVGGWDPGVYINQGVSIARNHGFRAPPLPCYRELSARGLELFTRGTARYTEAFPGCPIDPHSRRFVLYFFPLTPANAHDIPLPFFKNIFVPLGIFYIPFVGIVITGASNAVNLTDGLDGLASGCVIIAGAAFSALCYIVGRVNWSGYLAILHVPQTGELTVFCAALVGAAMSFLWFNAHPAEVFMGDTGSLSLGGALGVVAVMLKQELLLLIIGGVFVAEALSVMIQVASYRFRGGRRVFLMAPLHHHFEMLGWPEAKIITRFWIAAAIFALLGLATLKIR